MPNQEMIFWGAMHVVLFAAAVNDLREFRIPNILSTLVVVLFVPYAVLNIGFDWAIMQHVGAGLLAFAIGVALFATGIMGGGDVKLFAAVAIWHALHGFLELAFLVSITGALVGVGFAAQSLIRKRMQHDKKSLAADIKDSLKSRIPYGVGIFAGSVLATYFI